ncbi:SEC-C metal-binding domain-containing protein [Rhizobium leguminosarum]|uniref:SEC-C metal-binding domain-containing protein n=1 Tax=Rhizobium TaxID=379 RepID=UPI001FE08013|nr:SEC-C metal-binding domain-containing protein [Rhizobium leguminosarum]
MALPLRHDTAARLCDISRMKTGRNELCPCGSGKKFKKCCLNATRPAAQRPSLNEGDPALMAKAQAMLRQRQAAESVRQQQQGHGNPIVSWTDDTRGHRYVAVKLAVHRGKDWVIFPNFLDYFMKKTLGQEWGERERHNGQHPLFRWLKKTQAYSVHKPGEPKVKSIVMMGFMACWLHLAYALYLIAHHDEIPKLLLDRLRNPIMFLPAYHEAIMGAALAVAGMEISCAETEAGSTPTPEFRAKSKASGRTYEVEGKRKNGWKAPTDDVMNAEFQRELQGYVRNQIWKASKKKLKNPVYWFELSIPSMTTEAEWRVVADVAEAAIRDAENNVTVDGQPIAPAYVIITNHTFLADEDVAGQPCFGLLQTIKIEDYPFGRPLEIEAALEGYDKHRDIFWLMEAWKTASTVPTTFDGSPPELLDSDGKPQRTVKIGDMIEVLDSDGKTVLATVEEISSWGDKAMVAVGANGHHWLVEMPLTAGEAEAARRYTDAVFGKNNASRGLRNDDPFDLYDWMLKAHAKMEQVQVDKYFEQNPAVAHHRGLPLGEARIRVAREYTKSMWISSQQNKAATSEQAAAHNTMVS